MKFRFHWLANGVEHETTIEAENYPMACYKLALSHARNFYETPGVKVPVDFSIDLSKTEIVE